VDPPSDLVVRGAPTALRRALTALVDNAIAHSERGGVVRVVLHADPGAGPGDAEPDGPDGPGGLSGRGGPSGPVRVIVQDEGEGLDPADATSLRQRFARGAAGSTGGGRRFGLGLALVDEVMRAHHGRLEITGAHGEGSSFTMLIPRQGNERR
jgi:signal transduction histidine kinase